MKVLRFSLAPVLVALMLLVGSEPAMATVASGRGLAPSVHATAGPTVTTGSVDAVTTVQTTAAVTLRRGMSGSAVRALQERLVELRYWLGKVDGVYGYLTEQAVMAFQKVNGLTRDGIAGPQTMAALRNPIRPKPRSTGSLVVEVVKSKQAVLLVRYGKVRRIFNASTGKSSTPTPSGRFRVYRQINGWRDAPLGLLYRPKYFLRGYAVHGSTSVPAYPASHGCVRVNLRAMDFLWYRVPIGTRVRIY
jgi:lipoprotein-anchoring transpeptidase ErfK/SrfK